MNKKICVGGEKGSSAIVSHTDHKIDSLQSVQQSRGKNIERTRTFSLCSANKFEQATLNALSPNLNTGRKRP